MNLPTKLDDDFQNQRNAKEMFELLSLQFDHKRALKFMFTPQDVILSSENMLLELLVTKFNRLGQ